MSTTLELTAVAREKAGKGAARALRREGMVPAVIYGGKEPPVLVALESREIVRHLNRGGFFTNLCNIQVDGTSHRVIARAMEKDPVKDFPIHLDFLRLVKGATVDVEIPVHFRNEDASPGLQRGGTLNVVRHTVEVTCPAESIPDEIVVDLTGLDIGDSVHISAVTLPAGVSPTITDRDFTVVTIAAPTVMPTEDEDEEAEALAASAEAEGSSDEEIETAEEGTEEA